LKSILRERVITTKEKKTLCQTEHDFHPRKFEARVNELKNARKSKFLRKERRGVEEERSHPVKGIYVFGG